MRIRLLPSAFEPSAGVTQYLTSYLINDAVVVDAGSVGFFSSPQQQARVEHVLLTHSHIDHVASLPILLENSFQHRRGSPVTVHGSAAVLDSLQRDLFNDRVWPDFIRLSQGAGPEFLRLEEIREERRFEVAGLRIQPVAVNHVVPTQGFIIEDDHSCVVIASDTAPTERIWQLTAELERVDAVFLEASFPESESDLAELSKHLTPSLFKKELEKFQHPEAIRVAVHIKAPFLAQVVSELEALQIAGLEVNSPERVFEFDGGSSPYA